MSNELKEMCSNPELPQVDIPQRFTHPSACEAQVNNGLEDDSSWELNPSLYTVVGQVTGPQQIVELRQQLAICLPALQTRLPNKRLHTGDNDKENTLTDPRVEKLDAGNNNTYGNEGRDRSIARFLESVHIAWTNANRSHSEFVVRNIPRKGSMLRKKLLAFIVNDGGFDELCSTRFGRSFLQTVISVADESEQQAIFHIITPKILVLSLHETCFVVKAAVMQMEQYLAIEIIANFTHHVYRLALDRWGSQILLGIMERFEPKDFAFVVSAMTRSQREFRDIVENKNGCRVVQFSLQRLGQLKTVESRRLSRVITSRVLADCSHLVSHQFGNFVVQDIISSESYFTERNYILKNVIAGRIVNLSQEKYASHVVECAFKNTSGELLEILMHEVFNGYFSDRGREALDVLLLDQYGNYVAQTMMSVAEDVVLEKKKGRTEWLRIITTRIRALYEKLSRYSSGKRIISRFHSICGLLDSDERAADLPASTNE